MSSRLIIVSQEKEHQVFLKVKPSTNKEKDRKKKTKQGSGRNLKADFPYS